MHIFNLVLGIWFLLYAALCFYWAGENWPKNTYWKDLPKGKYITTQEFDNNRIVIKDVYGKEVVIFERKGVNER
jgi:hypothetical protein